MQALVYTGPNQLALRHLPEPRPAHDEVLVRVEAVGICGSDMHAYHGHDPRRVPPMVLGHEVAGEIIEGPLAGRRVVLNPIINCGDCDYCLQGRDNLCSNRTMLGMSRPGGFAELLTTAQRRIIEIPPHMPARTAALTEPAATALHAIDLGTRALRRPLPECRVLILGGGAVGMLATLLLASYGVSDIIVAEINELRRASIGNWTRASAYDPTVAEAPANACDLVIDAVGAKATRNAALSAVRPGGVVVHVGLLDWSTEIDMRKLTLAEITLVGTYTYTMTDMRATVSALDRGVFGDLAWVDERPLAEGVAAFRELDLGQSASAKIVLRPLTSARSS
jgi:alcohol dehydrogenase